MAVICALIAVEREYGGMRVRRTCVGIEVRNTRGGNDDAGSGAWQRDLDSKMKSEG